MSADDRAVKKAALAEAWEAAARANVPLQTQLTAYADASRAIIPDVLAAYDRMVTRLEGAKAGVEAPQVGEQLPDMLLPDAEGRLVALSTLCANGPLVISFNRGHWCPYCRLELRALGRLAPILAEAGAGLVSIVPETATFTSRIIETNSLAFPVLSDLDHALALQLGLAVWTGEELNAVYAARGIDLERFQGNAAALLPIPATFVADTDGRIRARFVDPEFRRRMPIEDIMAALNSDVLPKA
jgi:peroxiredoxin